MMYYAILILALLILAILSYKRIDLALGIVILTLPFYLIRLEILSIPTTALELMIYVVFLVWMIKKVRSHLFKTYSEGDTTSCRFHHFSKSNFTFPILLILLGCIISIIVSPDKQAGLGILKGWFIDPLLLFLIISDVVKTPPLTPPKLGGEKEGVIKILSFLAASGIIVAVVGLFYYFLNELTYDGRLKAFFLSPNHLAMYLAPTGIICLGLFLFSFCHSENPPNPLCERGNDKNDLCERGNKFLPLFKGGLRGIFQKENDKIISYFYLLGFIICLTVIFLTYSYGAWIGFGAGILFLIFFSSDVIARNPVERRGNPGLFIKERNCRASFYFTRNDSVKKVLLLIIAALFLSTVFFSQRNTEKFQNLANFSRSSFESRIMIWKSSAAILKDHPFLGIGPGNFQNFYLDYQKKFPPYLEWAVPQPHNLFLAFYLQCGLLGLIGFLWLIFLFFKKGFQAIAGKRQTVDSRQQTIILITIMFYILIHGLIDTPYWKNDLAIIFWIIIGLMKTVQDSELKFSK